MELVYKYILATLANMSKWLSEQTTSSHEDLLFFTIETFNPSTNDFSP